MRQLRHIGKPEGGGSALDGVSTTENTVQLFVISRLQVEIEQHLLHQIQVSSGFLKEDLIELTQIKRVS